MIRRSERTLTTARHAIFFFMALSCAVFAQFSISQPSSGVPEFAQPAGTIQAEAKMAAGLTNTLWVAVLANELRTWTGIVEQVEYGDFVDHGTAAGYRLTIRTPSNLPPEVFSLILSHPSAGAATNRNAVSIVPNLEDDFYILHYADPQAGGYEPDDSETGMCGHNGSIREILWQAPALSLIHPRFLFDTGDELDDPYYAHSTTNYEQYIDAMSRIGAPVLVTRGNNDDMISTADWRNTVGLETYSIIMGSFYICQKDYNEDYFSAWFTNDYASSFTNPVIQYRLFGQHYSDGACSWLPPEDESPNLMLVGHIHINAVVQSNPYPIVATAAAFDKGSVGFFEFSHTATNWICTSLTNLTAAQFPVMSSGAVARITQMFACTNSGVCFSNTSTIVNQIPHAFRDGRVRFLMAYSPNGYTVSNGVKLSEYVYDEERSMAVVVRVNIAANTTTVVYVQADEVPCAMNGTPHWWLAKYGLPTNDAGALYDEGDGMPAWQEYAADTDPTNAASCFTITGTADQPEYVLQFHSSAYRFYTLSGCSNLLEGSWSPVKGVAPRRGIGGPDQVVCREAAATGFYRLDVEVP